MCFTRESANERHRETTGTGGGDVAIGKGLNAQNSTFVSQLLQKYQMMQDGAGHGGMLPIGNSKLFGGLLHNPGQRSIVGVAHERA